MANKTPLQKVNRGLVATLFCKGAEALFGNFGEAVGNSKIFDINKTKEAIEGAETAARIGAGVAGAYAGLKIADLCESPLPEHIKGLPTALVTTLGVSGLVYLLGDKIGLSEHLETLQDATYLGVTKDLITNYFNSIRNIGNLEQVNAGYLAGALVTAGGIGRFLYDKGKRAVNALNRRAIVSEQIRESKSQ